MSTSGDVTTLTPDRHLSASQTLPGQTVQELGSVRAGGKVLSRKWRG